MTTQYLEHQILGDIAQPKADIYTPTALQKYRLGTRYRKDDGRVFHYAQANASSALVAGNLIQSAVDNFVANEQEDLAVATSSAIGDDFGYATVTTDTLTKDFLKDGWYAIGAGTAAQGRGGIYQIKSHPAGAAGTRKFTFYDKVVTAITAGSAVVSLIINPYKLVVQAPGTITGFPVGVALTAVTASYYFWLQTWGICNCLIGTAVTPGKSLCVDTGTAGTVTIQTTTPLLTPVIGFAGQTIDTTDNGPIWLTLAP